MKTTRRIILILVVLSVAVLAYSAGKKAGKPKKKFPYLSDKLNETVTMTRAEMAVTMETYRPMKVCRTRQWTVTKIQASLLPTHILLRATAATGGPRSNPSFARTRMPISRCMSDLRDFWWHQVIRRWITVGAQRHNVVAPPITVQMYEGKKLVGRMGLPTRDAFGKRIPPKIETIGDKPRR